ncbi:hypothetical protein HDV63DRAFT_381268 [Trichoderma sp. SZMC 28014]
MARRSIYLDPSGDHVPRGIDTEPSAVYTFFRGVVREARTWVSRGGPGVKTPTIEKQMS